MSIKFQFDVHSLPVTLVTAPGLGPGTDNVGVQGSLACCGHRGLMLAVCIQFQQALIKPTIVDCYGLVLVGMT